MKFNPASCRNLVLILIMLLGAHNSFAQSAEVDYNTYYQFPLSLGIEYQSLKPFGEYSADFIVYELSGMARYPLPSRPMFQPLVKVGMIKFDSLDSVDPDKWDHTHFYGAAGLAYASRFSKNFEVALECSVGPSQSIFPSLDPAEPRGALNLLGALGARISLNPSYNMSIDIHPNLKYLHSSSIAPVFAAMQNYYVKNPMGQVTITNSEKFSIMDMDISFFQAGYMDSPTKIATISELKAGESKQIDIMASYNQDVFSTEGITPLTGEIIADYISRNKAANQRFSISYDLHDKTALSWDDDRKVAAFITPADSALRNYSSYIRQTCKHDVISGLSEALQTGMQVYSALTEIGCLYQVDPTSPFTAAQDNPLIVDSISLPRDTLKRATGDCDDLTVLYSTILETVGIETAFITVPGHIYAAFNTKVSSRSYKSVHPDRNMTLIINNELWIPVEITMIGTDDFLSAWRKGIEQYKALEETPEKRNLIFTHKAQEVYRPVGLRETDLGLQYGSKAAIVADFKRDREKLVDSVLEDYLTAAQESGEKRHYNRLGVASAQFGRYSQAEKAFNTALSLDRNYLNPRINLGNVYYLRQEFQQALKHYHSAENILVDGARKNSPSYSNVLLNISKAYYELENYDKATEYYETLIASTPEMADKFAYLTSSSGDTRAARVSAFGAVLFAEEE